MVTIQVSSNNASDLGRPNILLICVDSLRADYCFDEKKSSHAPNLDFLIKNGIICKQAITSTDYTITSLSSVFNSHYPFDAGIKVEQNFNILANNNFLNILRNNNYNIFSTIPKSFSRLGFNFKFDNINSSYNDDSGEHEFFLNLGLGEEILENLKSTKFKSPWLYYIHLNDLHSGTNIPKKFDGEKFGHNLYAKKISAVDEWIGKFLKQVNIKNTLIVLFSDHGDYVRSALDSNESIDLEFPRIRTLGWKIGKKTPNTLKHIKGKIDMKVKDLLIKQKLKNKHTELTQFEKRNIFSDRTDFERMLYDDIVKIPLIFTGYNFSKNSISQQVRSIDIFPTILEILDIQIEHKNIQGQSLVPLFDGKKIGEQPAYMESSIYAISDEFKAPTKPAIGIRTSKYKYFRKIKDSSEKYLFDLTKDPNEENNISKLKPNVIEEMETILQNIRRGNLDKSQKRKMTEEETQKVEKELKKLGYI